MGEARKMVGISIEETSGVDHPAHLAEGWLVMKAASPTDVDTLISKMSPKEDSEMDKDEKAPEETEDKDDEMDKSVEAVLKAAPEPLRKMVESLQKSADEALLKAAAAEESLRKEREERADAEAIAKARDAYPNLNLDAERVGPGLRRLAAIDADLAKSIEETLASANAVAESSAIFAELGKSARPTGSAYEKAESMAKARVEEGSAATFEQALTDVLSADPNLYTAYLAEKGA